MPDVLYYRGDRTNHDPQLIYGPDMFGAHYRAVDATYNLETDTTTITFKPIPPKELMELAEGIMARGKPLWKGYCRE